MISKERMICVGYDKHIERCTWSFHHTFCSFSFYIEELLWYITLPTTGSPPQVGREDFATELAPHSHNLSFPQVSALYADAQLLSAMVDARTAMP